MVSKIQKKKPKKELWKKKEHILVVAQEIKFARLLSGNDKKRRDRVLKTLKKWLKNCFEKKYEFKEEDFVRLWKGLFYAVWMSDKPLVQEELCEDISAILDEFPSSEVVSASLMMKAGLRMLATEWFGIDQHRIDKFLMLVRRLIRGWFRCLKRSDWSTESCQLNTSILSEKDGLFSPQTPLYARNSLSMQLHITDCYLEELAKVSEGNLPETTVSELIHPFARYMALGSERRLCIACRKSIFNYLIRQSELGIEYETRRMECSRMGWPAGGPDALELASDDDNDDDEEKDDAPSDDESPPSAMDPRAGRVDVTLSSLPVPATLIAELLDGFAKTTNAAAHKRLKMCRDRFLKLSQQEYPLKVECPDIEEVPRITPSTKKRAARKLQAFESRLIADSDELSVKGLSKKLKKRLLAQGRDALVNGDHDETLSAANGQWQVEETDEPPPKRSKTNNNKENQGRKETNIKPVSGDKKKQETKKDKNKLENKVQVIDGSSVDKKGEKTKKKQKSKIISCLSNGDATPEKVQDGGNKSKKQPLLVVNKLKNFQKQAKSKKSNLTLGSNNDLLPKKQIGDDNAETKKEPLSPAKNYQKQLKSGKPNQKKSSSPSKAMKSAMKQNGNLSFDTPKKVKFILKNNSNQSPLDYYKSVRQSPNIPFDSSKKPTKTNLKPNATPSPINPFFRRTRMKK